MSSKRVLITGIAGFIGYSVAKRLMESDYSITGLDNLNSYYDVQLKYDRLNDLGIKPEQAAEEKKVTSTKSANLHFVQIDLENLEKLDELFSNGKFDIVLHLAAQAGVRHSLSNPFAYINSNVTGFVNVLECCKKHSVQHLIYASSSSVYGLDSAVPFSEKEPAVHPVSFYAATKRMNEMAAFTYNHLYKTTVTGLRFFTVYGPWGRPDMSPMLFANAITAGKPIKIFNYGKMRRDFTYVDDVVEGILLVMSLEVSGEYRLYNIGNSKPTDLMAFIELLETKMGKTAIKELLPMQPGDVYETYADTSALFRDTGFRPSTPLERGVEKFLNWYLSYYNQNLSS